MAAKQNLDFCYVTSPASGVVGELPYKVGALVSASVQQPLTTVSDNSSMQVYFSMTEKDMMSMAKAAGGINAAIAEYPPVKLKLADGSVYAHEGHVATVSGVIDPATGSTSVRADFINPERLLKSGASGSIVIPHKNDSAILIPQGAVVEVQNKTFMFVVGADNKVKNVEVQVYPDNDGKNYIITGGLKAGDKYVSIGVSALKEGMEIKPITEEQYNKKIKEAQELGKIQGDYGKMKEAFSGK